jgi:hypothetical protein
VGQTVMVFDAGRSSLQLNPGIGDVHGNVPNPANHADSLKMHLSSSQSSQGLDGQIREQGITKLNYFATCRAKGLTRRFKN